MKFLIYGMGWIGQQVVKYLAESGYEYVLGQVRVDEVEKVREEILKTRPTNILCLIGRTHGQIGDKVYSTIDYLEQDGKLVENIRDNLFSPVALALICSSCGVHLTYLGTGCIFSYEEEKERFREEDCPNFFGSSYSVVKGYTDSLMKLLPVCNARIRMPITSEPNSRNFITKIVNYEKICSQSNSMSVLDDLIPILISLAEMKFIGTINLTNPGVISHNEILTLYRDIVDPTFTWQNFTYEEQSKILACGRSNNALDTTLLESLFPVPNIKTSVEMVLKRMKLYLN